MQNNGTMSKLEQILEGSEVEVRIKRSGVKVKRHDPIPDIKWWDAPFAWCDKKVLSAREVAYRGRG